MTHWEIESKREIYANPVLHLWLEKIRTPEGRTTDWTVVEVGDGVAIAPVHADGSVTMIHQFRHAVGEFVWEFPAGRVENEEDLAVAAGRELHEEVGLEAGCLEHIGHVFPLDGICRHRIQLFRASDLTAVSMAHEPFETIQVRRFDIATLGRMLKAGELRDGISLAMITRLGLLENSS